MPVYKWLLLVLVIVLSARTSGFASAEDSNRSEIRRELSESRETLRKSVERLQRLEEKWGEGNAGAFHNTYIAGDDDTIWRRFGLRVEHTGERGPMIASERGLIARGTMRVVEVRPGSPAAAAGLRQDDRLISVNGYAVRNPAEMRRVSVRKPASKEDENKFTINREGHNSGAGFTLYGHQSSHSDDRQ